MTTATVPTVTVDPDALAYIDEVGLRAAFDHMLAATPRLVPGLKSIRVRIKPDWEYPQINIIWELRTDRLTKEVYLKAYREWDEEFARVVPERPIPHLFYHKIREDEA